MTETFRYPTPNLIESSAGYLVEILGPSRVRYTEASRALTIPSELLLGARPFVLYASAIRAWDPPHEREQIDAARRAEIVEAIRRAVRAKGYEIEVD